MFVPIRFDRDDRCWYAGQRMLSDGASLKLRLFQTDLSVRLVRGLLSSNWLLKFEGPGDDGERLEMSIIPQTGMLVRKEE